MNLWNSVANTRGIIDCVERVLSYYAKDIELLHETAKWLCLTTCYGVDGGGYEITDLSLQLARNDYIFSAAPGMPPHVFRIRANFAL